MFASSATELIGLDMGSSAIKMVEIKDTKQGYFLSRFGLAPLPPDAVVEGDVVDRGAVVAAIRKLQGDLGIRTKDVASCVSSKSVIIKKISLPAMSEYELEEQIPFEAEQHVPFNIDEVYLDYQPLETASLESDQMDVLLVAAKKDFVEQHRDVLKAAGLNCGVVDVDVFALENIYEVNYPLSEEDVIALVDLGAGMMKVNILVTGVTAFNRDVPLGGRVFTEEIQRQWNLGFEDAEALKRGQELPGIDIQDAQALLSNQGMALVSELENSFEFFLATPFGRPVTKIYLSGGTSKTQGLIPLMSERTGLPVEILNPFQQVAWDRKQYTAEDLAEMAPFIAVGAGLALRRSKER